MTREEAERFIYEQRARYELDGITGATRKQRRRMAALDVVDPMVRQNALELARSLPDTLGWPPHGDSGMMRVYHLETGEIRTQRAPALKLDLGVDEVIDELQTAAL